MMSIAVLHHQARLLSPISRQGPLELGAILVLGAEADATVSDVAGVIAAWRSNAWCPVVVLGSGAAPRTVLRPLMPDGMRIELAGDAGDAAAIRAAVAATVPSATDLQRYPDVRLGGPMALAVARALDPDIAGTGARRNLARHRLPSSRYWGAVLATVSCLATAMARGHTEAVSAHLAGISVKTLSRRCRQLFNHPWRALVSLSVWEAALE